MAIAAVLGVQRGTPWVLVALTKSLPCLGPLWFLIRGDLRQFALFFLSTSAVAAVSFAIAPSLWSEWIAFLNSHRGGTGAASLDVVPPLWLRLPVSLALVVWGARTRRP